MIKINNNQIIWGLSVIISALLVCLAFFVFYQKGQIALPIVLVILALLFKELGAYFLTEHYKNHELLKIFSLFHYLEMYVNLDEKQIIPTLFMFDYYFTKHNKKPYIEYHSWILDKSSLINYSIYPSLKITQLATEYEIIRIRNKNKIKHLNFLSFDQTKKYLFNIINENEDEYLKIVKLINNKESNFSSIMNEIGDQFKKNEKTPFTMDRLNDFR